MMMIIEVIYFFLIFNKILLYFQRIGINYFCECISFAHQSRYNEVWCNSAGVRIVMRMSKSPGVTLLTPDTSGHARSCPSLIWTLYGVFWTNIPLGSLWVMDLMDVLYDVFISQKIYFGFNIMLMAVSGMYKSQHLILSSETSCIQCKRGN